MRGSFRWSQVRSHPARRRWRGCRRRWQIRPRRPPGWRPGRPPPRGPAPPHPPAAVAPSHAHDCPLRCRRSCLWSRPLFHLSRWLVPAARPGQPRCCHSIRGSRHGLARKVGLPRVKAVARRHLLGFVVCHRLDSVLVRGRQLQARPQPLHQLLHTPQQVHKARRWSRCRAAASSVQERTNQGSKAMNCSCVRGL